MLKFLYGVRKLVFQNRRDDLKKKERKKKNPLKLRGLFLVEICRQIWSKIEFLTKKILHIVIERVLIAIALVLYWTCM